MTLTPNDLISVQQWRYASKKMDPLKKLTAEQWKALETSLHLTPSSYGLQPWMFIVVQDKALRDQLLPLTWNQKQVVDCSQYVIFCAKEKVDEAHITHFVEQSAKVNGVDASALENYRQMMIGDLVKGPRSQWISEWATRQCYIALGNLMTSAALIGVDTCPIEGFKSDKYDEVLELKKLGLKSVVCCAVGHRAADDKYAHSKKVRFDLNEVLQYR